MNFLQALSPHFNERLSGPDMIIIHYTDMVSSEETLKWFKNPKAKVSAHYMIDDLGKIYQIVPEDKRAWHAGESYWKGRDDINSHSIGIELTNPGHTNGYLPFPDAQIESLLMLCGDIKKRWDIQPSSILGHSDVAPRRKQDPGHLFPWATLAKECLGLWPAPQPRHCEERSDTAISELLTKDYRVGTSSLLAMTSGSVSAPRNDDEYITTALSKIGYETKSPTDSLIAFQRHFQQHKVDGIPDNETIFLIEGLL